MSQSVVSRVPVLVEFPFWVQPGRQPLSDRFQLPACRTQTCRLYRVRVKEQPRPEGGEAYSKHHKTLACLPQEDNSCTSTDRHSQAKKGNLRTGSQARGTSHSESPTPKQLEEQGRTSRHKMSATAAATNKNKSPVRSKGIHREGFQHTK
jgi:hypothetical protein